METALLIIAMQVVVIFLINIEPLTKGVV